MESLISTMETYSRRLPHTWSVRVTKYKRFVFRLVPQTGGTGEIGFGSLVATPTSRDWKDSPNKVPPAAGNTRGWTIGQQLAKVNETLLPTPRVADTEGAEVKNAQFNGRTFYRENSQGVRWGIKLKDAITLLRTPSAHEPGNKVERLETKDGEPPEIGKRAYDKETGRLAQMGLTQQIELLATPNTMDSLPPKSDEHIEREMKGARKGRKKHCNLRDQIASGPLLPTPIAGDWKGQIRKDGTASMLSGKMALLPTPTARDMKGTNSDEHLLRDSDNPNHINQLPNRIKMEGMIPTPTASDRRSVKSKHGLDKHMYQIPTPTASGIDDTGERALKKSQLHAVVHHSSSSPKTKTGLKLQPPFVEWMMGFPLNWTRPIEHDYTKPLSTSAEKKLRESLDGISQRLKVLSSEPTD